MNRTPSRPPPAPTAPGVFLAVGAVAAALAYAGGRWSAELLVAPAASDRPSPSAPASPARPTADDLVVRSAAPARPEPGRSWSPAPPLAATPTAAGGAAAPLLGPTGRPTRELVARVAAEATRGLEEARADFAARCVPAGSHQGAKLTFNVTFDASGREVARGISEDRRSRAPEVASCLRRLPIGSLRVSAPGAHVGVRVAMQLP